MAKEYTIKTFTFERVSWNEWNRKDGEIVTGTLAELRHHFGVNDVEKLSWRVSNDKWGIPTKVSSIQRLESFLNARHGSSRRFIVVA